MSAASARYMGIVAGLCCAVCRRFEATGAAVEVHHVAQGSGLRSDYAVCALCSEHHRGSSGLHGMGTKAFLRLYRPTGDTEYGLLVWTAEDLAKRYSARLAL